MQKILICDDNVDFTELAVRLLNKYAVLYDSKVIGFTDGSKLLEYCRENEFDIIYMDIEIGTENGMALAKTVKKINPNALIIYISAYENYYVDMVQAEPFRFILKEAYNFEKLEREFANTLDAAMRRLNGKDTWSYIFGRKQYSVELTKVKYFHSIARTIHIVGNIGKIPNYYYGKIDELQRELEKRNSNFMRISKSCIINMKYARLIGKNRVKIDDTSFSVTSKYLEAFRQRYKDYWSIIL